MRFYINLPLLSLLLPPFFDFFSAFSEFFLIKYNDETKERQQYKNKKTRCKNC